MNDAMAEGESSSRPRPGSVVELLRERFESPQQRGRVFERLLAAALRAHPGQYGPLRFKRVWRWSDWPDREREGYGADVGIDLVAEQTNGWSTDGRGGGLCAIQAKLHDPSASLGKAAVDSFLSASSAGCFTSRLLVVTAKLGANAALMVEKAQPRCEVLHVEQLDEWDKWPVDWAAFLERPEELRFEAQRYAPKCYQKAAVEAVVSGLDSRDCGKLILPCGTGKSVVALWIAERIAGAGRGGGDVAGSGASADAGGVGSGASCSGAGAAGKVLYLVPSIALMGQTMREWAAQRDPRITHRYIGVCSDTRAGRNDEDADLTELAMPVTTDSQRVAEALSATASANDHAADTGTAGIDTAGADAAGADAGDSAMTGAAIRGAGTVISDIAGIDTAGSDIASSDAVGADAAGADAGDSATMGAAIRGAGTVSSDIAGIDTAGSDAAGADISLPDSAAADSAAADSADTDAEGAMTVVFCTYQSLEVIEQAQRAVPGGAVSASFDLVICDEAHRTTGVHETDAGSHFTLIHDRRRILADKRLYMTATPRIYTDRVRAQAREHSRDFDVFSMDDETVFGPEFYRMSFGEAVEGEHLSDYKVLVIAVSELHVSSLLGNEVLNLHDDEAAAPRGGGVLSELSSPRRLSGSRPRRPSSSWVAGTPSRILPLAARTVVSPGRSLRRVPASGGPLHSPTRSSLRCWSSSTGTA
ncbi:MAG: DEAD/DEAH box helicase family protein [Acidimicrobiaceae bacterium]|nr:DEAD/DEAH box helicase family protein [Acidimicrobiaceae bacterium]MCY4293747.1 DEAD/DEAH box helicase family protein [Acidimicrobiaceae bacterium]